MISCNMTRGPSVWLFCIVEYFPGVCVPAMRGPPLYWCLTGIEPATYRLSNCEPPTSFFRAARAVCGAGSAGSEDRGIWELQGGPGRALNQIRHVHGHLINLCGVELLDITQDTDIVTLDKVDGNTWAGDERGMCFCVESHTHVMVSGACMLP